jgi:hypothetical protein
LGVDVAGGFGANASGENGAISRGAVCDADITFDVSSIVGGATSRSNCGDAFAIDVGCGADEYSDDDPPSSQLCAPSDLLPLLEFEDALC